MHRFSKTQKVAYGASRGRIGYAKPLKISSLTFSAGHGVVMSMIKTIVIPIDPFPKGRPIFGKGFAYTPAATRSKEKALKLLIKSLWKEPPWKGALAVSVVFTFKRPKSVTAKKRPWPAVKPDIDNVLKGLFDCANLTIFDDDSQIVSVTAEKRYGKVGEIWLCVARYEV